MLTCRMHNLSLMIRCYFRFRKKGRANMRSNYPKKVLFVQLAKLGDMVCTTPAFRTFKEKYPEAKLFVLGDAVNKELLANNTDVSSYIIWAKNFKETLRTIKHEKFDFALLAGPSPETLALLYLSGIPHIVAPTLEGGYSPLSTREYRFLTNFVDTRLHKVGNYAPREYLRLLEAIDIHSENTRKNLSYSQYGREKAIEFYKKNNINIGSDFIVGIFPSTGYKIKLWGRDKFARVAEWLWVNYKAKIVLIGSESDRKEVEEFLMSVHREIDLVNAFNVFNLNELKAAISMMSLFISVDSGPIYIAEAFGVPTVDIVGPMNDLDQPPRGSKNRIVKAERRAPAITVLNTRDIHVKEALRQSEAITAEMVIKEIEKIL